MTHGGATHFVESGSDFGPSNDYRHLPYSNKNMTASD